MESEQLKLLARSIVPIDSVAAGAGGMGLKVFVDEEAAVFSVKSLLERMTDGKTVRNRGPLTFCVSDRVSGAEYDITPSVDFALNPQIKGAIKLLGGVVMVEDM